MVKVLSKQERAKDARLRREYHITLEEFNEILAEQKNACAICKKVYNKKGKKLILCVDHDHFSGEVRGLVCWQCNKGIAIFQDDYKRLENASNYLIIHPAEIALGGKRFTAPGKVGTKARRKLLIKFNQGKDEIKEK